MLFNSAVFILLFFLVFNLYWLLPLKGKHILIVVTSLIFYAWYSFPFLLLFLTLILFNYALSIVLLRYKSKLLLILGLIVDLGNLFFFKYFSELPYKYWISAYPIKISTVMPLYPS